ncbi:MAG: tetratricopeptide (TPR) repeat protein, partial [Candidatus Omnitrophota bacterium]
EARQLIIDDQSRNQTYETFIELADLSHWLSEYEVEVEYLKKALVKQTERNTNKRDLLFKIGECLRLLGKNDEALKYYNLAESETEQTVDRV